MTGFRSEFTRVNLALDIDNQSQNLHVVFELSAIFRKVNLPFSHTKMIFLKNINVCMRLKGASLYNHF